MDRSFDAETARTVHVAISPEIAFDAKKMQKVTANLLGRLGCPACHSGFDIRFRHLLDYVVNPASLEVQPTGFESQIGARR